MVGERAQAVYDAVNLAPRTWVQGPVSVAVSAISFNRAQNRVTLDAAISFNGVVIADDRWVFTNPPTMTGDGTFQTVQSYTSTVAGDKLVLTAAEFAALTNARRNRLTPVGTTWQRENQTVQPLAALKVTFEQTVRQVTADFTKPHMMRNPDGTFRGDTLTVFATSGQDGWITTTGATIADTRTATTATAALTSDPLNIRSRTSGNTLSHACIAFDTSALGSSATITAAVLSLAGNGTAESNTDSVTMNAKYYDYGSGAPTTADKFNYTTTGWTGLVSAGNFTQSGWNQTDNAFNAFSDSGVYSSISLTGVTRIIVGNSLFPTGTPTGDSIVTAHSSAAAGTTGDPKLVITYTAVVNASITGVTGTATAAGVVGSVTAVRIVSVTGVTGTATAAGVVGSVTAVRIASVTGVTATATAAGIAGALTAVETRSITGVTGTATATGVAGAVTAQVVATVTGVTATATADGNAGSVNTGVNIAITGVTATADAAGIAGSVSTVQIVSITGETATATAAGQVGAVTAQVISTVTGVTGTATATGNAGVVTAVQIVSVTGVTAAATATGVAGSVSTVRIVTITGTTATATATGIAGQFIGTASVSITGVTATATAAGIAGSPQMLFYVLLVARYAPTVGIEARYAATDALDARHAVTVGIDARHAATVSTAARQAVTEDLEARYAQQIERPARYAI